MDTKQNKNAVLLNYGLMVQDVESSIREKANFMHRFFVASPELARDRDLLAVGEKFVNLLNALKALDETLNVFSIGDE